MKVVLYFIASWGTWMEHSSYDNMNECLKVKQQIETDERLNQDFEVICVAINKNEVIVYGDGDGIGGTVGGRVGRDP